MLARYAPRSGESTSNEAQPGTLPGEVKVMEVADTLSGASTPLDEDFLPPGRGWSSGAIRRRSLQHKIGIGCLAQIDIGEETSIATNRHATASCKQCLEQGKTN